MENLKIICTGIGLFDQECPSTLHFIFQELILQQYNFLGGDRNFGRNACCVHYIHYSASFPIKLLAERREGGGEDRGGKDADGGVAAALRRGKVWDGSDGRTVQQSVGGKVEA